MAKYKGIIQAYNNSCISQPIPSHPKVLDNACHTITANHTIPSPLPLGVMHPPPPVIDNLGHFVPSMLSTVLISFCDHTQPITVVIITAVMPGNHIVSAGRRRSSPEFLVAQSRLKCAPGHPVETTPLSNPSAENELAFTRSSGSVIVSLFEENNTRGCTS